jgi:membrane associated rhomboid family serine protease
MIGLAIFGAILEGSLGIARMLLVYAIAVSAAGAFYYALESLTAGGLAVLIGSSGGMSGLVGVALARKNIVAYCWVALEILVLIMVAHESISGAFVAHAAGLAVGVALAKILSLTVQKSTSMIIRIRSKLDIQKFSGS